MRGSFPNSSSGHWWMLLRLKPYSCCTSPGTGMPHASQVPASLPHLWQSLTRPWPMVNLPSLVPNSGISNPFRYHPPYFLATINLKRLSSYPLWLDVSHLAMLKSCDLLTRQPIQKWNAHLAGTSRVCWHFPSSFSPGAKNKWWLFFNPFTIKWLG